MSDNLANAPVTQCFASAGLSAGTTTTYSTANTVQYAIRGKFATPKTAVTNGATPVVDVVDGLAFTPQTFPPNALTGGQGSIYFFCFNAAGTIGVAQGSVETLDLSGNFVIAPQPPVIPDTYCAFGYVVVKLGPTAVANWTFGTNNLSAVTGVTYSFANLSTMVDRPQIA